MNEAFWKLQCNIFCYIFKSTSVLDLDRSKTSNIHSNYHIKRVFTLRSVSYVIVCLISNNSSYDFSRCSYQMNLDWIYDSITHWHRWIRKTVARLSFLREKTFWQVTTMALANQSEWIFVTTTSHVDLTSSLRVVADQNTLLIFAKKKAKSITDFFWSILTRRTITVFESSNRIYLQIVISDFVDISVQTFRQCVFCFSFRWSDYWLKSWHRITNVLSNFLLIMKSSSWRNSLSLDEISSEEMIMCCFLQLSKYCWICS